MRYVNRSLAVLMLMFLPFGTLLAQGWGHEEGAGHRGMPGSGPHGSGHPMAGPGASGYGGGYGNGRGMLDAVWSLGLSESQTKSVRKIMKDLRRQTRKIRDEREDVSDELWALYAAESYDVNAIGAVHDKIFALKKQGIVASLEAKNAIRKLLTEEQRQAWTQRAMKWRWSH